MDDDEARTNPVQEDIRFQHVVWTVERVTWVLLALVPLIALTGIFAHGAFSETTVKTPDASLSVEYERFQRSSVLARFIIRIPAGQTDETALRLSPSFQQTYEIQSLQPQPARSVASAKGLDLFFLTPEDGGLVAVIWGTPRRMGGVDLKAETGGSAVDFPVFIYP